MLWKTNVHLPVIIKYVVMCRAIGVYHEHYYYGKCRNCRGCRGKRKYGRTGEHGQYGRYGSMDTSVLVLRNREIQIGLRDYVTHPIPRVSGREPIGPVRSRSSAKVGPNLGAPPCCFGFTVSSSHLYQTAHTTVYTSLHYTGSCLLLGPCLITSYLPCFTVTHTMVC